LSARLTELAANKATAVVIEADASTSHKRLVEVMDTCKAAGVQQFSLRTTSMGQE
jgi:biopolymer transport protein ExbD